MAIASMAAMKDWQLPVAPGGISMMTCSFPSAPRSSSGGMTRAAPQHRFMTWLVAPGMVAVASLAKGAARTEMQLKLTVPCLMPEKSAWSDSGPVMVMEVPHGIFACRAGDMHALLVSGLDGRCVTVEHSHHDNIAPDVHGNHPGKPCCHLI